jgi:hypothetical protein
MKRMKNVREMLWKMVCKGMLPYRFYRLLYCTFLKSA